MSAQYERELEQERQATRTDASWNAASAEGQDRETRVVG